MPSIFWLLKIKDFDSKAHQIGTKSLLYGWHYSRSVFMEFHSSFGESWQVCTSMCVSFQIEVGCSDSRMVQRDASLQPRGREAGRCVGPGVRKRCVFTHHGGGGLGRSR